MPDPRFETAGPGSHSPSAESFGSTRSSEYEEISAAGSINRTDPISRSPSDNLPLADELVADRRDSSPGSSDVDEADSDSSSLSGGGGWVDEAAPGSTFPVDALPLADGPTSLSPVLGPETDPANLRTAGSDGGASGAGSTVVSTESRSSKTHSPVPIDGARRRVRRASSPIRELEGSEDDSPAPQLDLGLPNGVDAGLVVTFPMLERISAFERETGTLDLGMGDDGGLDGMLDLMGESDDSLSLTGPDVDVASEPPFGGLLDPSPLRLPSAITSGSPTLQPANEQRAFRPASRLALGLRMHSGSGSSDSGAGDDPPLPFGGSQGQGDDVFLDGTDTSRPSSSLASAESSPTRDREGGSHRGSLV